MDIEKLTKSQIVLLTLLVSFMTSIATGIVTVSLMEQAPPAITQTVSRVIEHTVEKVVPGQTAAAATPGSTVVIKESDLIAQAVEKVSPSIVRIYSSSAEPVFLGLGLVLDTSGTIVSDAALFKERVDAEVELSGSAHLRGFIAVRDEETGLVYLRTATSTSDGTRPVWTPAKLSSGHTVLGQSVATLGGRTATRLAVGIVAAITPLMKDAPAGLIETNITETGIFSGGPLFDTAGNVLGVSTGVSRTSSAQGFISASLLNAAAVKETGASEL